MRPMMVTLAEIEREAILTAVGEFGLREAARCLGVGKTTIYRKLKEYGVKNGDLRRTTVEQSAALATVRSPRFLMLPSSAAEVQKADLVCPKCMSRVILPNEVRP